MTAQILDGKATAAQIRAEIAAAAKELARPPGLATVLVGEDAGSQVYVRNKHRACDEVGFVSQDVRLPADAGQDAVLAAVAALNADPTCDGFIVQLPLPAGAGVTYDEQAVLEAIDPAKDADGLHPVNLGRLVLGEPGLLPCTPRAILELGRRHGVEFAGANVVIIGRGTTAGRPLGLLLTMKGIDATVTTVHSRTPDVGAWTRDADIVVAAVGRAGFVTAEMVKPGAVVFDVGISRTDTGTAGDVDAGVREVASWVSPYPGGVGPMTIAMLLQNTLDVSRLAQTGS